MIQSAVVTFTFPDESSIETDKIKSLSRIERACSDMGHHAQSSCSLSIEFDATLLAALNAAVRDIKVIITVDGARYFTGEVPPTWSIKDRGSTGGTYSDTDPLALEVVDSSNDLAYEVKPEDTIAWTDCAICDPAHPETSLVHKLIAITGYTSIVIAETIPTVLSGFAVDDGKIGEIIDELLYHYGFTWRMNLYDQVVLQRWSFDTLVPASSLDEAVLKASFQSERIQREADGVELSWWSLKEKNQALVFMADLPFGEDNQRSGYPVQPDFLWPDEANVGETWFDFQDKSLASKIKNGKIVKNEDYTQLILTKNHTLDVHYDTGLVPAFTPIYQTKRARIAYDNPTASSVKIYYCDIFADVVYRAAVNKVTAYAVDGGKNLRKVDAPYIIDQTSADKAASMLAGLYKAPYRMTASSETEYPIGAIENISDPYLGIIDAVSLIVERRHNPETGEFTYKGITLLPIAIDIAARAAHLLPGGPLTKEEDPAHQAQDATVNADAAIAAAREASIELSITANQIVRSRAGVLTPATVTASSKYGDDNTPYAGRLEIATSTDGLTFDIDNGIPNDPAGAIYLQKDWPTTDSWVASANVTLVAAGGTLKATKTISTGQLYCYKSFAFGAGQFVKVRVRAHLTGPTKTLGLMGTVNGVNNTIIKAFQTFTDQAWFDLDCTVAGNLTLLNVVSAGGSLNVPVGDWLEIDFVYVGTGAGLWYRSAADESSKVYTPPVTSFGAYVVMLRIRLYKAGGFTINLREKMAGITLDPSSAARYWGPLTTAPTSGICVNDYYFDLNTVAGGGGIVRYWTGSVWAEMTSDHALWKQAWGNLEVLIDASEWANAQASVVAAATAIFEKLFASYIIAAYIFAQQIDVASGGRIRFFSGQGVQKRCVELADEHIDWIDTPDVSPAQAEVLQGRISRLGRGDTILLSGKFAAPIESPIGSESTINAAYSANPTYIQLADGQLRIAYLNTYHYLVERIWSGTAWGSESTINAAYCYFPSYIQLAEGQLRIAYINTSLHLVERIWSGTAWGSESTINAATSNYPSYIQLADGQLRIAYRNASNYLVERIWSGTAWGSESTINAAASSFPTYIQLADGQLRIAYLNTSAYLVERIWSGTAWGSESTINAAYSPYPSYIKLVDEQLKIVYNANGYHVVERAWNGVSWDTEVTLVSSIGADPTVIQLQNGDLRLAYIVSGYLVERIREYNAQLGAGIIESGYNANGRYVKFSDGTMMCWGSVNLLGQAISTNMIATWTYPVQFVANPGVQYSANAQNSGSQNMIGLQAYNGMYLASPGLLSITLASYSYRAATGTSSDWVTYNMMAIGRWK